MGLVRQAIAEGYIILVIILVEDLGGPQPPPPHPPPPHYFKIEKSKMRMTVRF